MCKSGDQTGEAENHERLNASSKSACIKDGALSYSMMGIGEPYVVSAAILLGAAGSIVLLLSPFPRFLASVMRVISSPISCRIKPKKQFVFLGAFPLSFIWVMFASLFYFAFGWGYAIPLIFLLF